MIKTVFPSPPRFIRRPIDQRRRHIEEIRYSLKHEFGGFRYVLPIVLVFSVVMYATAVATSTGFDKNSTWYSLVLTTAVAIIIAIVVDAVNRKSNREIFSRIRKIEGLVHVKLDPDNNGRDSARFHIGFALEGILYNMGELEKEIKLWLREDNIEEKEIIKKRCNYLWKNSLCHYVEIINDSKNSSVLLFNSDIINRLRLISEQCIIDLTFDDEHHICRHIGFDLIIIQSLLLLDMLKIETRYKDLIYHG
ncbi:hypothetical protein [Nitrosopumilus oxyclinae]|uniref:hypothetical protein n=1 Tax=Nitrosopumilus oxyclinae TaxID=1959104 RepID=UPI0015CE822E|nr:hypothetical protein [Nitrosopumilus oxyclinae]